VVEEPPGYGLLDLPGESLSLLKEMTLSRQMEDRERMEGI
jgi:hypothetical protein